MKSLSKNVEKSLKIILVEKEPGTYGVNEDDGGHGLPIVKLTGYSFKKGYLPVSDIVLEFDVSAGRINVLSTGGVDITNIKFEMCYSTKGGVRSSGHELEIEESLQRQAKLYNRTRSGMTYPKQNKRW